MLNRQLNDHRLQRQQEFVQPILKKFIHPVVIFNIMFNPVKLLTVIAITDYWNSVQHRNALSFLTTGAFNNNRFLVTDGIRDAINLPNNEFIETVRDLIAPMRNENSSLYSRLNSTLNIIDNKNRLLELDFIQGLTAGASTLILSTILCNLNETLGSATAAVCIAACLKALYDMHAESITPQLQQLFRQ